MRIVFGEATGSVEMADQCRVIDLTDDFDFDAPESGDALQAMPAQIVVGWDEILIGLRIAMDNRKVKPQVQAHILNDLAEMFDRTTG